MLEASGEGVEESMRAGTYDLGSDTRDLEEGSVIVAGHGTDEGPNRLRRQTKWQDGLRNVVAEMAHGVREQRIVCADALASLISIFREL
jgi:hypothetical protein